MDAQEFSYGHIKIEFLIRHNFFFFYVEFSIQIGEWWWVFFFFTITVYQELKVFITVWQELKPWWKGGEGLSVFV